MQLYYGGLYYKMKLEKRCEAEMGINPSSHRCVFTYKVCDYQGRKSKCDLYKEYVKSKEIVERERI